MVKLGDEVRDKISGFTGVAMAEYRFLTGCTRIEVQPPVDKKGKLPKSGTFDMLQLAVVKAGAFKPEDVSTPKDPGGPPLYTDKGRPNEGSRD